MGDFVSWQISGYLNWIVRTGTEVEMNMNAVERMLEYTQVEQEPKVEKTSKYSQPEFLHVWIYQ